MKWKRPATRWVRRLCTQRDRLHRQHPERKGQAEFAAGLSLPDPQKVSSAVSEGNKTRIIGLYEGDTVNESALKDLIRASVERNLAKAKPACGR